MDRSIAENEPVKPGGGTRLLGLLWLLGALPTVAQETMIVHLPGAPVERADQLAEAVTALGRLFAQGTPDLRIEVKLFQRWEDAHSFLTADPQRVAIILSDASFLVDLAALPGGTRFVPSHRFVRSNQETFRRLLVVKASRQDLQALDDLRGQSLSLVKTTGDLNLPFINRAVFRDELNVERWFGRLVVTTDDFSAVANVLYDQTDVALVSEENPLLLSHLGEDLRQVFRSPPLSRPVFALRQGALTPTQRAAWDGFLERIGTGETGREILSVLKLDAVRPVPEGSSSLDRAGLMSLPSLPKKSMDIAFPRISSLDLQPSQVPQPQVLTYSLAVELPAVPAAAELLGDEAPAPPQ